MTIQETNLLHAKAKTRKDGVYSFRGNLWAVKNGHFIAFSTHLGDCYQCFGSFNVYLGRVEIYNRKQKLIELIK